MYEPSVVSRWHCLFGLCDASSEFRSFGLIRLSQKLRAIGAFAFCAVGNTFGILAADSTVPMHRVCRISFWLSARGICVLALCD